MLRHNFESTKTITPFYTGGATQLNRDTILSTYLNKVSIYNNGKLEFMELDDDDITCFYKQGNTMIAASKSLQLGIYNGDYELQRQMKTSNLLTSCTVESSETFAAFGGSDGIIHVYNLKKRFYTHKFTGHRSLITKVEFIMRDDKLFLISCGDDGTVRLWNLNTSKSFIFQHHDALVKDAIIREDMMLIVSRDQTVSLWSVKDIFSNFNVKLSDLLLSTLSLLETVETGGWLTDKIFYTAGESGILKLWTIESLNEPFKSFKLNEPIYDSHLSNNRLCIVSQYHNFFFLTFSEQFDLSSSFHVIGYNDEILQLEYSNEDIVCATNSNELRVFCKNGDSKLLQGHDNLITCFDIFEDKILTGSKDKSLKLWDYKNYEMVELQTFNGHVSSVSSCCFNKTGTVMFSTSSDMTLKSWSLTGTCNYTIKAHEKDINCVKISPNNQWIATTSQDKTIKMWNASDGSFLFDLKGHKRSVWFCNFSQNEKALVSGSGDMTVKIWSLSERTCTKTLEGHFQSILYVNFMNEGTQIVSSGSDGLIKIWDKQSGAELQTIEAHEGKIWSCCVKENGQEIVSGATDAKIQFFTDFTKEYQEKELKEKEIVIEKEQKLTNLIRASDYEKALTFAAELKMSNKFMEIFKIAYNSNPEITQFVSKLDLTEFLPNWLSFHKHQFYAHLILNQMILADKDIDSAGILVLTQKHFNRIDQLMIDSNILKITHLQAAPLESKKMKLC